MKTYLNHKTVRELCKAIIPTLEIIEVGSASRLPKCYPIPRGGVPAAYALSAVIGIEIVATPEEAEFFFDDIIDSGATMKRYCDQYPGRPFLALIDKTNIDSPFAQHPWIVFPWEGDAETGIEDNIKRILQYAGEDVEREGLIETPRRVAKALKHWFKGYDENAAEILKVFEDGSENYDQMVVVKDIPLYSKCEHHMADIFGTATIAYIPDGKIVGLSKLSRLVDMYARRLQVQERLTSQIAESLQENLLPKGVGVMIRARHMCMESRGICQQGHHTVTISLKGAFKDEADTRAEFLAIARQ
jgi:GTP cyclohydrolase I